jgi:glycosyltransferase involved in cell wall biosynthesis
MKKLLFLATYPQQSNGYAKVGNKITNYLADNYKVYYFGFSNYMDVLIPREVHSNIEIIDVIAEEKNRGVNDSFGVEIIEEYVRKIEPDIIVLYNDVIVTCRHLNVLNKLRYEQNMKFKFISYLDLVYDFEKSEYINFINKHSDGILVFSEHWKVNLITMGVPPEKIDIIYHGFDTEKFHRLNKVESRKALGLNEDDFIILNANRNSYRNANDIAISAFIKFWKLYQHTDKVNKLKFLIHCDMNVKSGFDIYEIVKIECIKEGVDYNKILNNNIIRLSNNRISDDTMNKMYNACDMGINTCIGEGFGLCSFEHVALAKPQVVSYVGAHKDIFRDYPEFTILPVAEYNISAHTDDHCGTVYVCRSKDFADKIDTIYKYYKKYEIIADKCSRKITSKYNWSDILKKFSECLEKF